VWCLESCSLSEAPSRTTMMSDRRCCTTMPHKAMTRRIFLYFFPHVQGAVLYDKDQGYILVYDSAVEGDDSSVLSRGGYVCMYACLCVHVCACVRACVSKGR